MQGVCGRTAFRTNVNLPNMGQMLETPLKAVVQANAISRSL